MKQALAFSALAISAFFLYSSCNKIDWRPPTDCDVQQFGTVNSIIYSGPSMGPFPYQFAKTYDASGNVETIDAYLFSIGVDFNLKSRFSLKGQTLYCINVLNAADTFMIVQLNTKGRPVKAVEKRHLNPKNPGFPVMQYEFIYNKNRLYTIVVYSNNTVFSRDTCTYDNYGNLLSLGRNTAFEYDYTRKPKQQYYYDAENLGNFFYGLHFLQFLNFFPEISSPLNVRTKHRVIRLTENTFYLNYDLANHQFDSKGKLIAYDYGYGAKVTTPILYNCNAAASQ